MVNSNKVYVRVTTLFDTDGMMLPRALMWTDGKKYRIDRVIDIKPAHAMKAGRQGDRYTVMINGQQRYLFFERSSYLTGNNVGRWFVERQSA